MTRIADFSIYVLAGIVVLIAFWLFARYASAGVERVFYDLLMLFLLTLPVCAAVVNWKKHRRLPVVLALLAEAVVVSRILAHPASPLGMDKLLVSIVPFFFFEKAPLRTQTIAVVLGALSATGTVVVNAGLVGFGVAANVVSGVVLSLMFSLVVVRFMSSLRAASLQSPSEGPSTSVQ